MPSSKTTSGMSNVECLAFPTLSSNKELLRDKSCHMIEPYDDGELMSIFAAKDDEGFAVKILDKNGTHMSPDDAGPIGKELMIALNIGFYMRLKQFQMFFSIKDDRITLVDVYDGKTFISPGMLKDVFGKRLNIQNTKSIEKYDPGKTYGAIIKPNIVCYDDGKPIYIKA